MKQEQVSKLLHMGCGEPLEGMAEIKARLEAINNVLKKNAKEKVKSH